MNYHNKVQLAGEAVSTPALIAAKNTAICKFTLKVVDEFYKNTAYVNCKAFGKLAEETTFAQGDNLEIEGKIYTGSYEKEGRKIYYTDVICSSINLIEKQDAEPNERQNETQEEIPF